MMVKVVDASAMAAVLFGEPDAESVVGEIEGCALVVPTVFPYEIASVCRKKMQLHPSDRQALLESFSLFQDMEITESGVDFPEVIALAERQDLTVYDAAYLWLSRRLDAPLVTLDKRLASAAEQG